MKKLISFMTLILLTATLLSFNTPPAYAAGSGAVSVNVNGKRIHTDSDAYIKNSRTLVPLRGIFEELGAAVDWIPESETVVVNYKDKNIQLQIGNTSASINSAAVTMDVAPEINNSRTMIPLRFIAENMGMSVQWIPEAALATITSPDYFSSLPEKTVLGFTTSNYLGDTASQDSLERYKESINTIATFSYQVDNDGNIKLIGPSQTKSVKYANSNNIKPLVLIHNFYNGNFDRGLSHAVLSDAHKRQRLINNILVTMSKEEYSGVNIDIENVYWYDRDNYTALIKELKTKLAQYGFMTTISIPAKTADSYTNNWGGAFDYPELGKYADRILLMTYDEHYFGGTPGPVASLPWVENVLAYATKVIPSQKLLLGIPGYGYDWASTGSKAVTFKNVNGLLSSTSSQSSWDDNAKSPFFSYIKNGVVHNVWYEDTRSLAYKLPLVDKYSLGGIGIWRLGYDDASFWETFKSILG